MINRPADVSSFLSLPVVKHSVTIGGHSTSVSLEQPFWDELSRIASLNGSTLSELIAEIDEARGTNLSSALRLYVLHSLSAATAPQEVLQEP